jgi:lipopolysaccharide transport system permease protein
LKAGVASIGGMAGAPGRSQGMWRTLWRHRSLVAELVRREFSGRYRGSFGGVIWSFVQPLFLLAVYTIAFGVILKARWGFAGGTGAYALMVFAGLIVFNAFSECLARAPALVSGNPNFVKKIVFPLELLPWVMTLTIVLHAFLAIAVWLLGYGFLYGVPKPTALLAPIVIACFVPLLLGMGWLLAAAGVVVRDVVQLTTLASHALLFLTPIFYGVEAAPPFLQSLLMLNPLTFVVEELRLVLFFGEIPAWRPLAVYFALSCLFAGLALAAFRRLRRGFADLV